LRQESSKDGGPDPEQVEGIVRQALADQREWLDAEYQELGDGDYALHPLYRDESRHCSMLIAVLKPGVALPIHNHGSWAVIGVYRGREKDRWFHRLDDGTVPGHAELELERAFVNPRGTVSLVPDGAIHTVEALDGMPAVSIHVYGTDIVTQVRSTFDLESCTEEIFRPPFTIHEDIPQPQTTVVAAARTTG
jgi:predicted metal-dependent enzyme (double-stranded beta helix superfamily)